MNPFGFTCLVLLDEPADILPSVVQRALTYAAPRSSLSLADLPAVDTAQALRATVDGQELICAVFEHPMPAIDYRYAVENSIFWLDAPQHLAQHKAFVAITAPTRETAHGLIRAQAIAMTRLAAALCEALPSTGVYWQSAGVVSKPEAVARAAANFAQGLWPVDLWIGWQIFARRNSNQRVLAMRSRGAAPFLGFELQIPPFEATDDKEPMRLLMAATGHLIANGTVIKDGQRVDVLGERPMSYRVRMGTADAPGIAELTVIDADPDLPG